MTSSQIIVLATPVFFLLIVLEVAYSASSKARVPLAKAFRVNDLVNSISLGIMSQINGVLLRFLTIGIYTLVFQHVALFPDLAFWQSGVGVVVALLFYDFCYYWFHRAGHRVNLFWAAHIAHHQSQHYNLSTALRQSGTPFFGWIFYLPMALAGVPPVIFAVVGLIDLLYQFWVHTEQVGKLGWFDRWFCSPSNHRVHHAVNDHYVDKNYGGLLVIWDRLFGTFQEELDTEPCVYGTRDPLNSWDPLWANGHHYWAITKSMGATRRWSDKLRLWVMPPAWQPADLARAHPKAPFQLEAVTTYNPPLSPAKQWLALGQFAAVLAAVSVFLWQVHTMPTAQAVVAWAALTVSLWALGLMMQGRVSVLEMLFMDVAALATYASAYGLDWYLWVKPLPMSVAMVWIVQRALHAGGLQRADVLLLAAAFFSLGGDVFLMLPGGYFIQGLASFLVAHLFYLALFKQGHAWFPNRMALVSVLAFGGAMYAVLWSGLPNPVLKVAVAAYVVVISLMASQALGRATDQGSAASRWVAMGACVFMLSDSLIAINKFLTPIPLASVGILTTYFAAQMLMMHFVRGPTTKPQCL